MMSQSFVGGINGVRFASYEFSLQKQRNKAIQMIHAPSISDQLVEQIIVSGTTYKLMLINQTFSKWLYPFVRI
jgi:hypothetical protein